MFNYDLNTQTNFEIIKEWSHTFIRFEYKRGKWVMPLTLGVLIFSIVLFIIGVKIAIKTLVYIALVAIILLFAFWGWFIING